MDKISIDKERMIFNLKRLSEFSSDGVGVTRIFLTEPDIRAREFLMDFMRSAGLEVRVDRVGNVIGVVRDVGSPPMVLSGSHIDTVRNGGMLDGALGVVAALESVVRLSEAGVDVERQLGVVIFANEEGARYPAMTGSRYFCGLVEEEEVYRLVDSEGISYLEALREAGMDPDNSCKPPRPEEIDAYVELHIEQGPVLEMKGIPIGIVSRITGVTQLLISLKGESGHAGTTPMDLRRDAALGMAEAILRLSTMAKRLGLTATAGYVELRPNLANVIPAEAKFSVDVRHPSNKRRLSFVKRYEEELKDICRKRRLSLLISRRLHLPATAMSRRVKEAIRLTCEEMRIRWTEIVSGAGHDAMNMAKITDAGMIFIPSVGGISHSPSERSRRKDIIRGAEVLLNTLHRLARRTIS